jgi:AcrR family transcriptional regulator
MYVANACPTCASLRAAAIQLVADHGLDALSRASLGEAAGLTEDQVVNHYENPLTCLYEAYDELSADLELEAADAFDCPSDWRRAFGDVSVRLLTRLSENSNETRLLFVEALRGDRELRRRRERSRQRMVALFLSEHRRRDDSGEMSEIQLEMLLGASFHVIAGHVAEGRIENLPQLAPELGELAGMFDGLAAAA